jgi:hypothetical protein
MSRRSADPRLTSISPFLSRRRVLFLELRFATPAKAEVTESAFFLELGRRVVCFGAIVIDRLGW